MAVGAGVVSLPLRLLETAVRVMASAVSVSLMTETLSVVGTFMGARVLVMVAVRVVASVSLSSFWLPSVKIMPKASAIAIAPTTTTATTSSFCLSLRRIACPRNS